MKLRWVIQGSLKAPQIECDEIPVRSCQHWQPQLELVYIQIIEFWPQCIGGGGVIFVTELITVGTGLGKER
jgi:hypothetical protein